MDIVMSSNPAPTPNQYELRCAFKKYKDIKVHSNAFYGLQIRSNNPDEFIVGSIKKPSSIFGIAKVAGQYTCYANGFYSGAYAAHDPILVIETTHTVLPAPIGKWVWPQFNYMVVQSPENRE
uniref:Uncharacterized protein n=1 Tax=Romanomermis culicivorax TaxID=13658 RepID=A0A915KTE6_ROMCU